jgi:pyrrolidone-carboxylate peptidase
MKILLYGFGPYRQYSDNITEKIVRALPNMAEVEKVVFDATFDEAQYLEVFARVKPDIILGLGQHPRARKIRVERRARDARSTDGKSSIPIAGTGDMPMSLSLPQHVALTRTYDAGDYVCNFSMWLAETYARANSAKAGFLHVPRQRSVPEAVEVVKQLLQALRGESGDPSGPVEDY